MMTFEATVSVLAEKTAFLFLSQFHTGGLGLQKSSYHNCLAIPMRIVHVDPCGGLCAGISGRVYIDLMQETGCVHELFAHYMGFVQFA